MARAPSVRTFVGFLERMSLLDSAYWLSTAYADLTSEDYRATLAMYFTPPPIANRLMDDLENAGARFEKDRFIDPAAGGAAFLALVASRMRDKLQGAGWSAAEILRHAESHLAGYDVEPTLCRLSAHFLRQVFYAEICETHREPRFTVTCADSLDATRRVHGTYDVVICNPPFRKLKTGEATKYAPVYSKVMQGQSNLYALFIDLTIKLTRRGGLVGLVTPTSFLSGQSFGAVRTHLLTNTRVCHIGVVSERERVYLDVQQETALTVLSIEPPRHKQLCTPDVSVVDRIGHYVGIGRCPLPNSGSSWPLARETGDIALIRGASKSPFRLVDYGYSPVIGCFVWNRDTRPAFLTINQVPAGRRDKVVPLLWSSDIRQSGMLRFDPNASAHGQHRYVDFDGLEHAAVRRRAGIILQRVTSVEQPLRLVGAVVSERFLRTYGGFVGENHVVILEWVNKDLGIAPQTLLKVLRSHAIDRYYRCISGSSNVSVFELQQLPLPDPSLLKQRLDRGEDVEQATTALLQDGEPQAAGPSNAKTRMRSPKCDGIAA